METFTDEARLIEGDNPGTTAQEAPAIMPGAESPWAQTIRTKLQTIGGNMLSLMLRGDGARIASEVREARLRGMGYDHYPGPHAL